MARTKQKNSPGAALQAIRKEYGAVADHPTRTFHFHTGRRAAKVARYKDSWLRCVPTSVLASFACTGSPFRMGEMKAGEQVIDLGCGAGTDSFIAASQVGAGGKVLGVDMTHEMVRKARGAAEAAGVRQLRFEFGYLEDIPAPSATADAVISNGAFNLCPNKPAALKEMFRVLKPGGRIQIADIMVDKLVSDEAKLQAKLWTG